MTQGATWIICNRGGQRVAIDESRPLFVDFQFETRDYHERVRDVGPNGVAFVLSDASADVPEGARLTNAVLHVDGNEIHCELVVSHVTRDAPSVVCGAQVEFRSDTDRAALQQVLDRLLAEADGGSH